MSALRDLKNMQKTFLARTGRVPQVLFASPEMLEAINESRRVDNPYGDCPADLKFGDVLLGMTLKEMNETEIARQKAVMPLRARQGGPGPEEMN